MKRTVHRALARPRWAWHRRSGLLEMSPHQVLTYLARSVAGESPTALEENKEWALASKHRARLVRFGFTSTAAERLEALSSRAGSAAARRLAAWHLAQWHASGHGEPEQAPRFLDQAVGRGGILARMPQAATVRAHAHLLLNQRDQAAAVLARTAGPDADLARAGLTDQSPSVREALNAALGRYGHAPVSAQQWWSTGSTGSGADGADLVSVILTTRNDENTVAGALTSVLSQTHGALEVLVVDAGSTDATLDRVREAADPRVRIVPAPGAASHAQARNEGLRHATGRWVTTQHGGQWSHPTRIATQLSHLRRDPHLRAVTCQGAVLAADGQQWAMDAHTGRYVTMPLSSTLVVREALVELDASGAGPWDSVTSGSHLELHLRMLNRWPAGALATPATGPLLISQLGAGDPDGLDERFAGRLSAGAEREYTQQVHTAHQRGVQGPGAPGELRAIPAPRSLQVGATRLRHVDVALASDFGLVGGSVASNVAELEANARAGLVTAVVPMFRYDGPCRAMLPEVQRLIDDSAVIVASSDDAFSAGLVEVRYPPVLDQPQSPLPQMTTDHVRIVVNQPPMSDYGPHGMVRYSIPRADAWAHQLWGVRPQWCPIGPQVREALLTHHGAQVRDIDLADQDWVNIIDVDQWRRPARRAPDGTIRVGRHARDHAVKWPASADVLRAAYPSEDGFEVHVLGGAEVPRQVLGALPPTWTVHPFGALQPAEFLAGLDVFVYVTHPDWVESFGRVVLEAMAVGVPAILPPIYQPLFGDAALYAQPEQVRPVIEQLMSDADHYQAVVDRAHAYVEDNYGYSVHVARVRALLN